MPPPEDLRDMTIDFMSLLCPAWLADDELLEGLCLFVRRVWEVAEREERARRHRALYEQRECEAN